MRKSRNSPAIEIALNRAVPLGLLFMLALSSCGANLPQVPNQEQPSPQEMPDQVPSDIPQKKPIVENPSLTPQSEQGGINTSFIRDKVTEGNGNWPFVPLDNPEFVTADQATYIGALDLVLGVSLYGESKAYPINMMWFHHVANDTIGGHPIAVTY